MQVRVNENELQERQARPEAHRLSFSSGMNKGRNGEDDDELKHGAHDDTDSQESGRANEMSVEEGMAIITERVVLLSKELEHPRMEYALSAFLARIMEFLVAMKEVSKLSALRLAETFRLPTELTQEE